MPQDPDREAFDDAVRVMRAGLTAAAAMATADGQVRVQYEHSAGALATELEGEVRAGRFTWRQAAEQAWQARDDAMELMRLRSTPIGRPIAAQRKPQGRTLHQLVAGQATPPHPNKG